MPSKKKGKKVTAEDVPGIGKRGGAARQAAKKIEKGKKTRQSRLDSIMQGIKANQFPDSHQ
jgi:hypothetical protein